MNLLISLTNQSLLGAFSFDAPQPWQILFQDAATKIMDNITDLHHDIMFFLVLISTFVIYMMVRIVTAYRISNTETVRTITVQHHTWMEVIWTLVPAVILMFIALPSYILIYNMDELIDPKITLKVIGHQWYWHYEYSDITKKSLADEGVSFDSYMLQSDDLPTVGALRLLEVDQRVVLPIDTSVRVLITSSDVIHSWAVPSLGIKLDACPGRLNQIGVNINRSSVFYGQCSEICGVNHSFMPIAVESCRLENYQNWLTNLEAIMPLGWFPSAMKTARRWVNSDNSIIKVLTNHVFYYPTPINLNYAWSFGSLAGIFFALQIATGVFLAMHYVPNMALAFASVEHIMRDVKNGWLLRYMHANGASFVFIMMYIHIGRNLYYRSYTHKRMYLFFSGVVIFLLMMGTAFIGYVLPWGQMSFWGATVITNLITAVPLVGESVAHWVWGGFSVGNPTLNRFFSLHYLLPFLILGLIFLHLALLHDVGSSNPTGMDSSLDKVNFYPYYFWKDAFALSVALFFFVVIVHFYPNLLGHSDNYIPANSLVTPTHIVPEWYFLPFYAILRAIPNKIGGVLAMLGAILVLFLLPFIDLSPIKGPRFRPVFIFFFWTAVMNFVLLGFLGGHPAEEPYITASRIASFYYFAYFLVVLPFIAILEQIFWEDNVEELMNKFVAKMPNQEDLMRNFHLEISLGPKGELPKPAQFYPIVGPSNWPAPGTNN
jgi:ubiquinol-cytochrome c reductase cytochrome b/c1 subunit